ncbi:MAG: 30S ribosomal protein S8 [Candidatus Brocadia sp.]|nr:30S ribosomal protein S8 [Candidatus Brocadia fulgida]MCC6325646.1 30S ribosomal protein S8 [Candidatus Brocadia sp.]MCE7912033.1 30S ribosomal protein S8 [Candidatus Brocadia sp. AMX3]MDG5997105.1 30S ribosomal protein S8 [Candidatus Brocadia sp.]RIJ98124.1 MAG: 30S ribosomal protein S8 [Candidatus Brocadia sp.]
MSMTDPISDMFTRMRNACAIKRESVDIPVSKIKMAVLKILREEGFIKEFKEISGDNNKGIIRVYLKYGPLKQPVINKINRVSKSSRRIYRGADEITKIFGGIGVAIYSTSKGVVSDKECRRLKVGGELIGIVT